MLTKNWLLPAGNVFPLFATTIYAFSTIEVTTFRVFQILYLHEEILTVVKILIDIMDIVTNWGTQRLAKGHFRVRVSGAGHL